LSAPAPLETSASWSDALVKFGTAAGMAKEHNITLALRNAPHTFGATTPDMKRVSKEADSAWLRYGPHFAALDSASEPQALLPKTVLVWADLDESRPEELVQLLGGYLGFVALDDAQGVAAAEPAKNALRRWRSALFASIDRT
jgi:hypothetical protein